MQLEEKLLIEVGSHHKHTLSLSSNFVAKKILKIVLRMLWGRVCSDSKFHVGKVSGKVMAMLIAYHAT